MWHLYRLLVSVCYTVAYKSMPTLYQGNIIPGCVPQICSICTFFMLKFYPVVPQKDDGTLRKRKVFSLNLNPEERKKTNGKLKGDEWVHQTSRFLKWKQTSYTPENKSLWERRKRWGIERAGEKCGGRGLGRRRMEKRDKFKWTLTETNCFCQTLSRFLGLWLKFDVECWDIVKKKIKIWERKMENFFNALIGPLRTVILFVIGNVNIAKE